MYVYNTIGERKKERKIVKEEKGEKEAVCCYVYNVHV